MIKWNIRKISSRVLILPLFILLLGVEECTDEEILYYLYLTNGQADWPIYGKAKVVFGPQVEGLRYTYYIDGEATQSGLTDEDGFFPKDRGKLLLSIGDIALSEEPRWVRIIDNPIITPMSLDSSLALSTDSLSINKARFIQSLDADNNPANGIRIANSIHTAATGLTINFNQPLTDFESDPSVVNFLASVNKTLTEADQALLSLETSLATLFEGTELAYYVEHNESLYLKRGAVLTTSGLDHQCYIIEDGNNTFKFDLCLDSDGSSTIEIVPLDVWAPAGIFQIPRFGIDGNADFVIEGEYSGELTYIKMTELDNGNLLLRMEDAQGNTNMASTDFYLAPVNP